MGIDRLLIIGNGFDKWCKLESSFGDYFYHNINNDISLFSKIHNYLNDNTLYNTFNFNVMLKSNDDIKNGIFSIWDLFFLVSSINIDDVNWFDIENLIYHSLVDKHYGIMNSQNFWEFSYNEYCSGKANHQSVISDKKILIYFYMSVVSLDKDSNLSGLYGFLKNELLKFEMYFAKYLGDISSDKNYINRHRALLDKLTKEVPNSPFSSTNVLSFNYTRVNSGDNVSLIENVHGLIDSDFDKCIIGVDSQKNNVFDKYTYKFTKTYRKLERYVFQDDKSVLNVLDRNISTISFFGHSLNEQDYSYFQSIFDFYQIYDNCTLIFYYTVYKPKIANKIKDDFVKAVADLLISYGKSMDNTDKGRNLLHKLIIESRIIIRRIPTFEELTDFN